MDESNIQKYIKQVRDEANEDMKQHLSALSEEFQHRTDVVVEQFSDIKNTLDSHTEMLGSLMTDMTEIKLGLKNQDERISILETKI